MATETITAGEATVTETISQPPITETITATETITESILTEEREPSTVTTTLTLAEETTTEETTAGECGFARKNPAPIGTTLYTEFGLFEKHKARITLLEVVRGEEALNRVREASNWPWLKPNEGYEYILAKIRVEYVGGPKPDEPYDFYAWDFAAVSEGGLEYEMCFVTDPTPELGSPTLYPGSSHEGWKTLEVAVADEHPLLSFKDQIWFKLYP